MTSDSEDGSGNKGIFNRNDQLVFELKKVNNKRKIIKRWNCRSDRKESDSDVS